MKRFCLCRAFAVVLGTSLFAIADDKKDIVDTAVGAGSFKTWSQR